MYTCVHPETDKDMHTHRHNCAHTYTHINATQCRVATRTATQHNATQRNATQWNAAQRNARQHNATQRFAHQSLATHRNAPRRAAHHSHAALRVAYCSQFTAPSCTHTQKLRIASHPTMVAQAQSNMHTRHTHTKNDPHINPKPLRHAPTFAQSITRVQTRSCANTDTRLTCYSNPAYTNIDTKARLHTHIHTGVVRCINEMRCVHEAPGHDTSKIQPTHNTFKTTQRTTVGSSGQFASQTRFHAAPRTILTKHKSRLRKDH